MDDALRELVESKAIEQLCIRYLDRIDANDPDGAAACFARREVVGIGSYSPGDAQKDRVHPGHPGRLDRARTA